jgi:hypothetical protein
MAGEKPTAGFVLSLVGGIFWVIQALVFVVLASLLESMGLIAGFGGAGMIGGLLAGVSFVFAILIILGGVMMFVKPPQAKIWGILVLVFAVIGFLFGGGFFIGSILALIGGILGLVWKPPMQMPPPMQMQQPMPPQ